MIKVGLSGTRFSGKNEVAKLFSDISIPVFDADLVIRFILAYEYRILAKIRDTIGTKYFIDGRLDADKIAEDGHFSKILTLIEPLIFSTYLKFEKKNSKSVYTVFNSSILFERNWCEKMDYNISVYAPFIDRVERAKSISEGGLEDISKINIYLNKESSEFSKNSLANYVIHNYNNFDIVKQVNKIDQKIIDIYLNKENKRDKNLTNKTLW